MSTSEVILCLIKIKDMSKYINPTHILRTDT